MPWSSSASPVDYASEDKAFITKLFYDETNMIDQEEGLSYSSIVE